MKVKMLKTVWNGGTEYVKGDIVEVSNNFGHGLLEKKFAIKLLMETKEIIAPKKNKMMSKKRALKTK